MRTTALAMGGSNQSLFLLGALLLAQGSAAIPLLVVGLLLALAAMPGWIELLLMWPKRVGGVAAVCGEAFRPYSAFGCGLALDDFGVGFGCFYYLKHLPCQYLKIDGEFIRALFSSPTDQVFVRAMVELAGGLGKQTIAEFVEDEHTLELISRLGVDFAQGYHVGRPAPLSAQPAPGSIPTRVATPLRSA